MKRYLGLMTILVLAVALTAPAVVLARGVHPHGAPPGQTKDLVEADDGVEDEDAEVPGQGKLRAAERKAAREQARAEEGKLTGIENAHARIQANIDKSLMKMADGKMKGVPDDGPAGLSATLEKFSRWIEAGGPPPDDTPDDVTGDAPDV